LFIQTAHGGRVRISADGYIEGAPDLVAEVSASTAAFDRAKKVDVYRENGVREYLVWLVLERRIEWFVRVDDRFEPLCPTPDGIVRSTVFPGLWLDPAALMRGDVNAVWATVQEGLRSGEHADFLARLEQASSPERKSS
jgi:Uma2 family endonuclease